MESDPSSGPGAKAGSSSIARRSKTVDNPTAVGGGLRYGGGGEGVKSGAVITVGRKSSGRNGGDGKEDNDWEERGEFLEEGTDLTWRADGKEKDEWGEYSKWGKDGEDEHRKVRKAKGEGECSIIRGTKHHQESAAGVAGGGLVGAVTSADRL
ncbi:hypothetical protein CBR_g32494 [Chara braunii]|uniref:Uncharacterized protein n=1 Tax=Chara braunii TaxID=69332 RepID=A0A388LGR3_CHABU|nr:hypothetical protein CBR_g32494 [Chara braunii]|eukprot:GBG81505.1 hypothetical protein CBR_g32494 [Chara braunii]